MNKLASIIKYYQTIKHLKLIQLYGQVIFRIKKPKASFSPAPPLRHLSINWIPPIVKPKQLIASNKLSILNQERDILANTIWQDINLDKLWLYNLHYFDVLNSSNVDRVWCDTFIQRWIMENPPVSGCGWDPYPISLRIVNWIKWMLAGNQATSSMLHSLAIQTRYLCKRIEIHLLGNHILANAKALIFSGLFFSGKEANRWFNKGIKLFNKEINRQILLDGGHCELSPMYHSIILEDFLDLINLFNTYGKKIPEKWLDICGKMFNWLCCLCHQDQQIAFFNDATLGVAPTLAELNLYQQRLMLNYDFPQQQSIVHLASSGYCRLQQNNILLLADIANISADYQPGHGHADALSFELSLAKQRVFVNSGTSCYVDNHERLHQRGSKAHNTVVVDNLDSSYVWKSFRVARRAKVENIQINQSENKITLSAKHNGYKHIDNIYHERSWILDNHRVIIEDHLTGKGIHQIELFFHLHPDIKVEQKNNKIMLYNQLNEYIAEVQITIPASIHDSTYHPEFNLAIANKKIVAEIYQPLPIYLQTCIQFHS